MAPTASSFLSCPASNGLQYTTGTSTFTIKCSTDYYGGDMGLTQTSTFEDCLSTCASTANCMDVAYVSPNCYMKNTVTTATTNDAVWGAILTTAEQAVADRISCDNNKSDGTIYTASSGAQFVIACGTDYFGGDMGNLYAETMEACLDACDGTSGCIDVAYAGKYCYLKNSLEPGQANGGVWGAKKMGSAATSSASVMTVTTTTAIVSSTIAATNTSTDDAEGTTATAIITDPMTTTATITTEDTAEFATSTTSSTTLST